MAELPIVLIVEDDEASIIEQSFERRWLKTTFAASAEEAVTLLKGNAMNCPVLVVDINLKGR